MTSGVEVASAAGHHRAWYESVPGNAASCRSAIDEPMTDGSSGVSSSVVEHMSSFFAAAHHNAAAALESAAGNARDYRSAAAVASANPYASTRDMLMSSRYYHQHSPYASHGKLTITLINRLGLPTGYDNCFFDINENPFSY